MLVGQEARFVQFLSRAFSASMSIMCALMKLIRVNSRQRQKNDAVSRSQSGKLMRSESISSETSPMPDRTIQKRFLNAKNRKYVAVLLVMPIVITVIVWAVVFSSKLEEAPEHGNDENATVTPTTHKFIIERAKWDAQQGINLPLLSHPSRVVILSHTITPLCLSLLECSRRVYSIKSYQISTRRYPDITYNFLIGGDGNAYVGRGWDYISGHSLDNSIGIAFIGDFTKYNLTLKMISAAQLLLKIGVEMGKLAQDYKLVCHNQTTNTLSPGWYVYNVVKNWPHFDANNYKNLT